MIRNTSCEQINCISPLVSVCLITYNHARFITQAVESVLAQKVNFEFEIIIGEDDSSDGTKEIALEYQQKFPGKLKVLLHSRNDVIYVNGRATGRWNFVDTLLHARGKYIAFMECDDFWTDPLKLGKQVELMETHPEYSICGHWTENVDDNGSSLDSGLWYGKACPEIFSVKQALTGTPLHPNSWLFRKFDLAEHQQFPLLLKLPAGDDPMMLILLGRGNGYCIKEVMSAYRHHSGGTWSTKAKIHKDFEMLQFRVGALKLVDWHYAPQVLKIIFNSVIGLYLGIGRETIQTRSLAPLRELLKLIAIQETMRFYFIVPVFLTALLIMPISLILRVKRRIVSRLRLMIRRASWSNE